MRNWGMLAVCAALAGCQVVIPNAQISNNTQVDANVNAQANTQVNVAATPANVSSSILPVAVDIPTLAPSPSPFIPPSPPPFPSPTPTPSVSFYSYEDKEFIFLYPVTWRLTEAYVDNQYTDYRAALRRDINGAVGEFTASKWINFIPLDDLQRSYVNDQNIEVLTTSKGYADGFPFITVSYFHYNKGTKIWQVDTLIDKSGVLFCVSLSCNQGGEAFDSLLADGKGMVDSWKWKQP